MNRTLAFGLGAVIMTGPDASAFGMVISALNQTVQKSLDPEVVALGQSIYFENCASCRGVNLEGQPSLRSPGQDGQLPAPPHDATGHMSHYDGDTLFRLIKYGTGALIGDPDYKSDMPIFGGVLTDDNIIAILSYIKST